MSKPSIYVKNLDEYAIVKNEETILDVLIHNNIGIDSSCGGMGTCGTCRIFVQSPTLAQVPRNEIESEKAQDLNFKDNERLCCQLSPKDFTEIEIPT